ncbi:MAG: hypothetical protein F4X62_13400, partial [Caldilineaceae bacterium SB0662_bin_25]|nr:hypothetical protein [Caldilineaceae bacterium SB0662_bin_25]
GGGGGGGGGGGAPPPPPPHPGGAPPPPTAPKRGERIEKHPFRCRQLESDSTVACFLSEKYVSSPQYWDAPASDVYIDKYQYKG